MVAFYRIVRGLPAVHLCLAASLMFVFAIAGIELTRHSNRIASVWLANGAILALLLRTPRGQWPAILAASFAANCAANLLSGDLPLPAVGLAGCNAIETALVARLLGAVSNPQLLLHPAGMLRLSLSALLASMVAAALAVAILGLATPAAAFSLFRQWVLADALGILIVTPTALVLTGRWDRPADRSPIVEPAAVLLLLLGVAMSAVFLNSMPALFLITPILLLAGFRLHPVAAALVGLSSSAVAVLFTVTGHGPIALAPISDEMRTLLLQANIAVSLMLTVPVSVVMLERRRLLADLARSECDHRLLAENSTDIIARVAVDGTLLYASRAAERILGYSPEAVAGRAAGWATHPDDLPKVSAVFARACRGVAGQVVRYRQRKADGGYIWLEAGYTLVKGPGGNEIAASIRDIDRRRRAEIMAADVAAKLRNSNRHLTMAEDLADVGQWRIDAGAETIDCSMLARRVAGIEGSGEITAANALAMVAPEYRWAVRRVIATARSTSLRSSCRARLILADGTDRHIKLAIQAERDPRGALIGLFGVIRDIGEIVANEQRLIAARDEARAAADAKSAFLATMSHEIRTPMTGVLGMIELLGGDLPQDDRDRYLATLRQSANLLMVVLNDVLDFSKIDQGMLELKPCDFDLEGLAQSTLDLFFNAASSKGLLIGLTFDAGETSLVRGDPVRVQQVLSNLINNAIKFTDQGRIRIRIRALAVAAGAPRTWRFEVSDTGIGIDPGARERLFEPFTQVASSAGRQFGGTGLGLAISRRLVTAMGGAIGVDSKPGKGSTFWFELPLEEAELPEAVPAPALLRRNALGRTRKLEVLVAEDNPVNQLLIEALLRRMGHQATCVANGCEAVKVAAARAFDCILMDMQMPVMDGVGATRAIRSGGGKSANAPIYALTADASLERRRFYDQAGLSGFLTKPVDSLALEARLAEIAADGGGPDSFDQAHLAQLRAALGPTRLAGLLELFAAELERKPDLITQLITDRQFSAVAAEAHSLKGAALSVGAGALAEAAAELERAAPSHRMATVRLALDRLLASIEKARAHLPGEPARSQRKGA